jgi:hypothetical protein
MNSNLVAASLLLLVVGIASDLNAAGVGKAMVRGATRRLVGKPANRAAASAAAKTRKPMPNVLKMDRSRDSKAPIKRLTQPRRVYRYTTKAQAQVYRQRGVPSGVHFTAKAGSGRPLTAARAKERYGLRRIPTARVEAVLPKGTTVKSGKAIGGKPGYGGLKTYRRPLPPATLKGVRPIQK